jgi:SHS2 domain-containing protein
MPIGFETFEHTADIGVRAWAPTLPGLIAPATAGLYATIGTLVGGGPPQPHALDVAGDEPELLLRDYLAEVLTLFERRQAVFAVGAAPVFAAGRLCVTGVLRALDVERSDLEREVKAVTYHELAIRATERGWELVFVVDI